MRFGVGLPQHGPAASPEALVRMARAAEDLGWDSVWASDHVVIPDPYLDRFGAPFYEVFATLGFVGAHTRRITLGTSVLLLAYRHPVMLAKQVATLDHLAGGRTIIGLAPGWMREEFEILDVPYAGRGRRADEALQALIHLWTAADPAFEGQFYRFAGFAFAPRPLQRPHPPLWIGGNDRRALRRTVEFGTGWHPISSVRIGLGLDELEASVRELAALARARGRDPAEITVSYRAPLALDHDGSALGHRLHFIGSTDEIARRLQRCARIGVEHVVFDCFYSVPGKLATGSVEEFIATMERFSAEVRPRL